MAREQERSPAAEIARVSVDLEQESGYAFTVRFNWADVPDLHMDEPRPHGNRTGPNASRLLAVSVGNCLCASLMFCLAKDRIPDRCVRATATYSVVRNHRGRVRIGGIDVVLTVGPEMERSPRLRSCLDHFEEYCTISESVRQGIDINVEIVNQAGERLRG